MSDSKRPLLLILGCVLLLAGSATLGFWWMERDLRSDPISATFHQIRKDSARQGTNTAERLHHAEKLYERITALHPRLSVTYQEVPDQENGFRKCLEFEKRHPNGLDLPKEVSDMISPSSPWNEGTARQWLADHRPLMDEIRSLGLLPNQSSSGIPLPDGAFFNARAYKQAADVLLMEARLLAAQGNQPGALESMRAATGFADHLDQIETPSLLQATVSLLIRRSAQQDFFKHILPLLALSDTELEAWQNTLIPPSGPHELGRFIRGEWHVSLRYLTIPVFLRSDEVKDPGQFIEAWSDLIQQQVDVCNTSTLGDLEGKLAACKPDTSQLSKEGKGIADISNIGAAPWIKGWIRTQVENGQVAAAFAHLRGAPMPHEPLTGKPFVWDSTHRTLALPADPRLDKTGIAPLVLPR